MPLFLVLEERFLDKENFSHVLFIIHLPCLINSPRPMSDGTEFSNFFPCEELSFLNDEKSGTGYVIKRIDSFCTSIKTHVFFLDQLNNISAEM